MESSVRSFANHKYAIFIILCLVFIVFLPSLSNDWVNWDDAAYVIENTLIQTLDGDHIAKMFTTRQVMGIYHPITLLSLAVDYHFWQLDAFGFHLTSLFLHLLNVWLLFVVIKRLSKSALTAFIVALLFGIHPMHVESVAWVSGRKDVLYTFFLLISWLFYLNLSRQTKRRTLFYILSLAFFSLSILSKSIAFVFPVVLILSDLFLNKDFKVHSLFNKLPYFFIALFAVYISYSGQVQSDSIESSSTYTSLHAVIYGSYNFSYYIVKMVFPFGLAAFHPFPYTGSGYELSIIHYLSIMPLVGIMIFLIRNWKKDKALFSAIGIYVITILPLLQIIPFGKALSSERYTYLSYIGLFLIIALLIVRILPRLNQNRRNILFVSFTLWICLLGILTFNQSKNWQNSETLWSQVIKQHPNSFWAYYSRGLYYSKTEQLDLALRDFDSSIMLLPNGESYYERGLINEKVGLLSQAKSDYISAIQYNADYPLAHLNLGVIYSKEGSLDSALFELDRAIQLNENYSLAYFNSAVLYKIQGNIDDAIRNFTKAIEIEPNNRDYRIRRGVLYSELKEPAKALADFRIALNSDPDSGEIRYLLAVTYWQLNRREDAKSIAREAERHGFNLPADFRMLIDQ